MSQAGKSVTQQLQRVSVEIHGSRGGRVLGTGVLVSDSGLIATCAHVLVAGKVDPRQLRAGPVFVRIPETLQHAADDREAYVAWFPEHHDDLVLLQLDGGPVPPERVAVCGPADSSDTNRFRSYGFRGHKIKKAREAIGPFSGLLANGLIYGHVPTRLDVTVRPVQLSSADLDHGMSGSAVFDTERNLIVGFVSQIYNPGTAVADRNNAYAVDAEVLRASAVGPSLKADALEKQEIPAPVLHPDILARPATDASAAPEQFSSAANGPASLGEYVPRTQMLAQLQEMWDGEQSSVVGLTGIAGQGKTSLVRNWLASRAAQGSGLAPDSVFWWSFDPALSGVDDFFAGLIHYLSGGAYSVQVHAPAKANLAGYLLRDEKRRLIVLDDAQALQQDRGELTGTFGDDGLREFLQSAGAGGHRSVVLLTSQLPFPDLWHLDRFQLIPVDRLSVEEGRLLLKLNGVVGRPEALDGIVADWDGHPLALTAVAIYLREHENGRAVRVIDLPGLTSDQPLATRLRLVGEAIQERRSPGQRLALELLSLARTPLSRTSLPGLVQALSTESTLVSEAAVLGDLLTSSAVREPIPNRILLHPVLRNLYRERMTSADPDFVARCHRLLAGHYYRQAGSAG